MFKRILFAVLTAVAMALAGCGTMQTTPVQPAPVASVPSGKASPALPKVYQVGDHLGFDRAVTFHMEVRQVCYSDQARDFLANLGKYKLSSAAKGKGFKMPKEALPVSIVIDGLSKAVNHGDGAYQLVDRDNKFVATVKASRATADKLGLSIENVKDPAFAVRMPYASFDRGAKQKAVFITNGWKLVDGTSSVESDFTQRVAERRTAMLQILFVDPSHPACN